MFKRTKKNEEVKVDPETPKKIAVTVLFDIYGNHKHADKAIARLKRMASLDMHTEVTVGAYAIGTGQSWETHNGTLTITEVLRSHEEAT